MARRERVYQMGMLCAIIVDSTIFCEEIVDAEETTQTWPVGHPTTT
jgi:hypothetical protein